MYVAYSRLDVSLLEMFADDREVGWYGAAQAFASLTMALTPFLIWVYMPLLARAVARSREEFYELLRRELEYTLAAVIPVAAAIALGADLWISLAFAERYAPAVRALRILGPMSAVTYVTSSRALRRSRSICCSRHTPRRAGWLWTPSRTSPSRSRCAPWTCGPSCGSLLPRWKRAPAGAFPDAPLLENFYPSSGLWRGAALDIRSR